MLYFTYNTKTDGLGGQYQRIIGIIALANKYNAEYVHTQITEMEHIPDKQYIQVIDDYFQIKNNWKSVDQYNYDTTIIMEEVDEKTILYIKDECIKKSINILIKIHLPRRIVDNDPTMYTNTMNKLRSIKQTLLVPYFNSKKQNIAIHIRRGDVTTTENAFRYTPIHYFKTIVENLIQTIPNNNICIFSEITNDNSDEFDVFKKYPSVNVIADADVITTMEHLIQADILVMCKSSFSYIAGLYNKNTVIYMDFWHPPMPNWNRINQNGW